MSRKTSKLIWSVPLVAVFAVIGALAIFAATRCLAASFESPRHARSAGHRRQGLDRRRRDQNQNLHGPLTCHAGMSGGDSHRLPY